jgi:hypothetical protein
MGIAEVTLSYLDLPDLSKMSVHDHKLTRGPASGPSRLLSPLSIPMRRKRPRANAF